MMHRYLLISSLALTAIACSSEPQTVEAPPPPVASTVPATQGDIARLEKENAELRAQLQAATNKPTAKDPEVREAVANVEARENKIKYNHLEPGMTLEETNAVITGSATVYSETCHKTDETDTEVTYVIFSTSQMTGPGSGGASAVGTNMRGERITPQDRWQCVFDKATGTLKTFKRF